MTLANVMLAIGSIKEKRMMFIPWLVLKMIGLVFTYAVALFSFVVGIIILVSPESQQEADHVGKGDEYVFASAQLSGAVYIIIAVFLLAGGSKQNVFLSFSFNSYFVVLEK